MHHLIRLLFLLTFINYCLCNCMEKLKRCDKTFQDEMKSVKFVNADNSDASSQIYYDICSQQGIYNRFVMCVTQLRGQCDTSPQFRQTICHNRALKMNSYRYTWKYNIIHDICYRTSAAFDKDFFQYEKCISKILNSPRWKCDETHYKMVKQTNKEKSCPHWDDFRKCTYNEVAQQCGQNAANVSDYLFHAHSSYFTKYTMCNLTGETFTNCWYDWLLERSPDMAASSMSSTQVSTSEWMEEVSKSSSSPAPKQQHSTFVSVQSSEHSTVESSEWNKMVTTDTSESYPRNNKKKIRPIDNDDSSTYVVEDNSISHQEEKHEEEKDDGEEKDNEKEKDEDRDKEKEEDKEKEKERNTIIHKEAAHTEEQVHSTLASASKELYQNDSDLKTGGNNNSKIDNKTIPEKPQERKDELTPNASQKQQMNVASASVVPRTEMGGNSAANIAFSPLLATLLSFLLMIMFSL